jgi:deoxyadenosine/deoxycytidine kinase
MTDLPPPKTKVVILEGNIGVGKSSVLRGLQAKYNDTFEIFPEPRDLWRNFDGKNYLQASYEAKEGKYNVEKFQILVIFSLLERAINILKEAAQKNRIIIIERSLWSAIHFIEVNQHFGVFDEEFAKLLKLLVSETATFLDNFFIPTYIFLKCSPPINYERVKKRGRPEEEKLELSYLERLNEAHEAQFQFCKDRNMQVTQIDTTNMQQDLVLQTVVKAAKKN